MLPQPLTLSEVNRPFRLLLYGTAGTGKTLLASTAQDHKDLGNVLFLDTDDGLATINHRNDIYTIKWDGAEIIEALANEFSKPVEKRIGVYSGIKTLVIDSVTTLKDRDLEDLKQAKVASDDGNKYLSYTEWNKMMDHVTTFIDRIAQTDINLILIAEADFREDAGVQVVRPALNPALWRKIAHRMDYIWRCYERGGRYRIQLNNDNQYTGKTRNPLFVEALASHNLAQAREELGDKVNSLSPVDMSKIKNTFAIPSSDYPTLAVMYDMYLKAIADA